MIVKGKKLLYINIISIVLLMLTTFSGVTISAAENESIKFTNAQEALKHLEKEKPKISSDGKSIILPESPDSNYEISLFGSDNKQIIDMELNYYQPISDMNVNLLYKVTDKNDVSDTAMSTSDISVNAEGQYKKSNGDNPVPNVIPGLREWKGQQGEFNLLEDSSIIIDSNVLMDVAVQIQGYINEMTGKKLSIKENTNVSKGDIQLILDSDKAQLGEEGYILNVEDSVKVTASEIKGIQYGGISLTQILYQSEDKSSIPKGDARDYPKYEVRSGMLDVGRMFIPLEKVEEMAEYMAWFKLNEIQMHINDYWGSANYYGFRVESKKYPEINAEDGYYSQDEYITFQKEMKKHGIDVVTEIDTPYHAESFRAVNPDMMLKKGALDITTPEKRAIVYPFIESLLDEFIGDGPEDENRVIQSDKFHIGTDEYDKKYSEEMRAYTDHFIKYVNNKGYETRLWGSIGKNGFDGDTPISNEATMNIWATHWSDVQEMYDLGYDIINTTGSDLYIVPIGNAGYPDYLDIKDKYDKFDVNKFRPKSEGGIGGAEMPLAHPQTKGAEFALWNDVTSFLGGLSTYDIFDRYKDAVLLVSEKTWYGEKTDGQTSEDFMERVSALENEIPMSNPGHYVESQTEVVVKYDFDAVQDNKVEDLSGNSYHGIIHGGNIVPGEKGQAFELDGNSYLEIPIGVMPYPYSVSFDIKLDKGSKEDATLFSGDEGSFYLNIDGSGKLGYERNEQTSENSVHKFENYKFEHDHSLKEEEWTNVIITGDNRETVMFIDGKKVSTAKQINKLAGRIGDSSTFLLPLEKIGEGIKGTIDNLIITNNQLENSLHENIAYQQKVTASSEYNSSQAASFITDGNFGTRWGSDYRIGTEKEKDDQWVTIELDDVYDLSTVKIFWEKSRANAYELQVSDDGVEYQTVYSHTKDTTKGQYDTINLTDVKAKYVKVNMSERSTTYGYSIFQIEIFGNTDIKTNAENLVNQIENLLASIQKDAGGKREREELVSALDELKDFIVGKDLDVFTYDSLAKKNKNKLEQFRNSINQPGNLALGQNVTVSSEYNSTTRAAELITDGDYTTRWGSQYRLDPEERDNQWVVIELEEEKQFDTVKINWENARAKEYTISISSDGVNYEEVYYYSETKPKGNQEVLNIGDVSAKYIKVALTQPTTTYGYSIYQLELFNYKETSKLVNTSENLLENIPEDPSNVDERNKLKKTLESWNTFIADNNKDAMEYSMLVKSLEDEVDEFSKFIVKVNSITIDKEKLELSIDENAQLTAQIEPANATFKDVVWNSADENIAKVDENGMVTAINSGSTTVTVKTIDDKHETTSIVTVKAEVIKSELEEALAEVADLEESNYTAESWSTFTKALEAAQAVVANEGVTQEEVDAALEDLNSAFQGLVENPEEPIVDKSELEEALADIENLEEADYTAASWTDLVEALEAAQSVVANEEATQEEVNTALESLNSAFEGLVEKPEEPIVDKSELEEALADIENLEEADYTAASWADLVEALEAAQSVVANEEATQEEVNTALESLNSAFEGLVEKPEEPIVDKSELEKALAEVADLEESNYTAESWSTFTEALEAARAVVANEDVTQEEVNTALESLNSAFEGLVEKPEEPIVDKSELEKALAEVADLAESNYTVESWTTFTEALEKAQAVLSNEDVTQEEVNTALESLNSAFEGLVEKPEEPIVDKSELEKALAEVADLEESNYTVESWTTFTEALEKAQAVLSNEDVTQEEVNTALESLNSAFEGLVEKPEEPIVDKSELEKALAEVADLEESNYTVESWTTFTEALEKAQAVLSNEDVTQEEVNTALESLNSAFEGLVEKPEEPIVDKSELEKALAEVADLEESNYTVESWTTFTEALEAARAVVANEDATQEEVDNALGDLTKAKQGLIYITEGEQIDQGSNGGQSNGGLNGTKGEGKLPKTASNMYNLLLIGSLLIIFSGLIYIRKQKNTQNI